MTVECDLCKADRHEFVVSRACCMGRHMALMQSVWGNGNAKDRIEYLLTKFGVEFVDEVKRFARMFYDKGRGLDRAHF